MFTTRLDGINDSPILDAFGRIRTSHPFTIFDSKQCFDDGDVANNVENFPLYFDNQGTGAGTSTTFDVTRASTTLAVSNLTTGTHIRQTRQRFNYQPSKSQVFFGTCVFSPSGAGIIQRYGLFEASNGVFFERLNGVNYVVRRFNGTDARVAQYEWNLDRLDGTGPSSITLDVSKTNIYVIDFEWLGVGRVRFGVVINGLIVYCHQMLHANVLTSVYMSTPNLPIRAEISNSGAGGSATFEMICAAVISEGGFDPKGITRSWNNEATPINLAAAASRYALLGIRLRSSHLGATILPESVSVLSTSVNDNFLWTLHLNPTINNVFAFTNLANSAVQVATGVTANTLATDGTVLASGYCDAQSVVQTSLQTSVRIGADIAGTSDMLVLAARPVVNNVDAFAAFNWREIL